MHFYAVAAVATHSYIMISMTWIGKHAVADAVAQQHELLLRTFWVGFSGFWTRRAYAQRVSAGVGCGAYPRL
jgi:hypothetical protein